MENKRRKKCKNETEYLLSSPKNAKRLLKSIEDIKKEMYFKKNLIEK